MPCDGNDVGAYADGGICCCLWGGTNVSLAISETATGKLSGYNADITVPTDESGKLYQVYSISFSGTSFKVPDSYSGGTFTTYADESGKYSTAQYRVKENATAAQVQADLSAITYHGAGTVTISAVSAESDTVYYNGHYYKLSTEPMQWSAAMTEMLKGDTTTYEGYKGHPVTVTSVEENSVVKFFYSKVKVGLGVLETDPHIWLGGIAKSATEGNSYTISVTDGERTLNTIPGGGGTTATPGKGTGYKWIWGTPEGDRNETGYPNVLPDGDYWCSKEGGEPNGKSNNPGYAICIGCHNAPKWDDSDGGGLNRDSYYITEYSPIDGSGKWVYDASGNSATSGVANVQSVSRTFNGENVQSVFYVSSSGDDTDGDGTKDVPYATIQAAYSAATDTNANVIYLLSNITQSERVEMGSGKNVTITSAGDNIYSIKFKPNGSLYAMFLVRSGTLTLRSITLDGSEGTSPAIQIPGGTVNLESGMTITGFDLTRGESFRGGVVVVTVSGTLNMSGSAHITGNKACDGAGVYVTGGTFNMSGGKISGNTASTAGGGVCMAVDAYSGAGGTFNMSGGEISDNAASTAGGGVYVAGGTFKVSGAAVVSDNKSGTNAENNVVLTDNSAIEVESSNPLTETARVGITGTVGRTVVTGTGNNTGFFSDEGLCIAKGNNELVLKAQHSWSGYTVTKPATTAAEGVETRTCRQCGAKETRAIARLLPAPTYAVTVEDSEHGSVTASNKNASKGSTVTLTVKPDEGYLLKSLVVFDKDGEEILLTNKGDGKYSFTMPGGKVTVSAVFAKDYGWARGYATCSKGAFCTIEPYADTDPAAWYHDGVHFCIENDLMQGVSAVSFLPNGDVTRAQVVTILWRLEGKPAANYAMQFADVAAGDWYAEAVRWAASNGIVTGYSDAAFGPNDAITREQFAAILYRYSQFKGYDVSVGEDTNIMDYDDVRSISSYAVPAIQWACGSGLMSGVSTLTLDPSGVTSRTQAATMFMRYCAEIVK